MISPSRLLGSSAAVALIALSAPAFAQSSAPSDSKVEAVTVTGTIIRGVVKPVGSNLITVGPEQIAQTGAVTISQVLATIPGLNNFGASGQGPQNASDPGGASSPTIHSLGNSASNGTLILVDGHRLPYTGIQHNTVDPSSIPVIALERVAVLPDGASATYGSDAVAGVLNFVTRKHYSGLQAQTRYSFADNYNNFSASLLGGQDWNTGSVLIAYEYTSKSALANGARAYETSRQDLYKGAMTDPANFSSNLSTTPPGGFLATTPGAGSGTSGPYGAAVPYPSRGTNFNNFSCPIATIRNNGAKTSYYYPYDSTTGVANNLKGFNGLCNEDHYGSDLPSVTRNTVFISFTQELTNAITLTGDFDFSTRFEASVVTPSTRNGMLFSNYTAFGPTSANTNQINPFYNVGTSGLSTSSTQISYDFAPLLAARGEPLPMEKTGDTVAYTNLGLDWQLGGDWAFDLGATFGWDEDIDRTIHQFCSACATLALNGTTNQQGKPNNSISSSAVIDPAGLGTVISEYRVLTPQNALDVWSPVGSNKTSQAVVDQLASGFSETRAQQTIQDVTARFGGTALELPAGNVKVAFGGEFMHITDQQLQNSQSGALAPASVASQTIDLFYGRTVWAFYGEVLVPVIGPSMNVPLMQSLTFDFAGRYDHYTGYGSTKNPKVSFNWDIIDGLSGRGSWGTSFTVPAFASGGQAHTGITSQSGVDEGGTPPDPVPFNNTTYNGGAGVAGTWLGTAAGCAAAGSQPVDANGNVVTAAPYTGAVACQINSTNNPALEYSAGGKPNLKPEVGMTYSAGFDFDFGKLFGDFFDGLGGEVTYYQAKYAGLVTSIGIQAAQPGLTYFAPPGGWSSSDPFITSRLKGYPLNTTVPSSIYTFFDGRQTNAFTLWSNGLDYGVHYDFDTGIGTWQLGINGNQILRFTQQSQGLNQPLFDIKNGKAGRSGRYAAQEMTWRTTVNWQYHAYQIGLGINYQSPYYIANSNFPWNLAGTTQRAGLEKIAPLFTADLNASYTLPDSMQWGLAGTQVGLNINNLFDTDPPWADSASGFSTGSQIGRLVSISLRKTF